MAWDARWYTAPNRSVMPRALSTLIDAYYWNVMPYLLILGAPYLAIDLFLSHFITVFASSFSQGIASTHSVNLSTITSRYWYPFVLCSHVSKISGNVLEWGIWDQKPSHGTPVSSCGHYRWHTQLRGYSPCATTTPPYFFELAFYWHALAWFKAGRVLLVPLFFHQDLHFFCLVSCFVSFSHTCWVSLVSLAFHDSHRLWKKDCLGQFFQLFLGKWLVFVMFLYSPMNYSSYWCRHAGMVFQTKPHHLFICILDTQLDQLSMFLERLCKCKN